MRAGVAQVLAALEERLRGMQRLGELTEDYVEQTLALLGRAAPLWQCDALRLLWLQAPAPPRPLLRPPCRSADGAGGRARGCR